jgi:transposase
VLHTDGHLAYVSVAPSTRGHVWVDHKGGEDVRDGVSTNLAETFFSQLKRSVDGTHHVSSKHCHATWPSSATASALGS